MFSYCGFDNLATDIRQAAIFYRAIAAFVVFAVLNCFFENSSVQLGI